MTGRLMCNPAVRVLDVGLLCAVLVKLIQQMWLPVIKLLIQQMFSRAMQHILIFFN